MSRGRIPFFHSARFLRLPATAANDTDFIFQPEILIRLRSRMFLFREEARCLARVREIYQTSDSVHFHYTLSGERLNFVDAKYIERGCVHEANYRPNSCSN